VWWSGRTIEIDMKVRKHTARERPHDAYFTAEFEIVSSHPFWFRGNRAWALIY
jgi:hypothetical protein